MKYVMFIAVDPAGEATDENPDAWVTQWNDRGVRIEGMGLRPVAEGKTVRARGDEVLVTDGPFAELAEWIAGYDLIEVADLDEAIEVARSHPMATAGRIELRPFEQFDHGPGTENPPHAGDTPSSRFLALFRTDPVRPGPDPQPDAVAAWVKEGLASGLYRGGEHLNPVSDATLVRVRGGELVVTDGAYNDAPEWVTGFVFIDGEWDDAVEYLSRCPMTHSGLAELREFWAD